jgi:Undecaprenyl-phosphate glucose phosphotransferase
MKPETDRLDGRFALARSIVANENLVARAPRAIPRRKALLRAGLSRKTRFTAEIVEGLATGLDLLIVLAASMAAFKVYLFYYLGQASASDQYALASLIAAVSFVSLMHRLDAYKLRQLTNVGWQGWRVLGAWGTVMGALLAAAFISKTSLEFSRGWMLSWAALTPALLFASRVSVASLIRHARESGHLCRNVVIVGANERSAALMAKLTSNIYDGINVVGVFDDRHDRVPGSVGGHDVLGTTDDLLDFVRHAPVDEVIVALPPGAAARLGSIFQKLRLLPVDLRLDAEPLIDAFPLRGITTLGDATLLEFADRPLKNWRAVGKWIEDRMTAVVGIILTGPLMLLIALLIKLESTGPVLFVQDRYGYNNSVIKVLKFRTMRVDCQDVSGGQRTSRRDPRVTRLGRFLRKYSLDELPQLFNVLKGDMSIVGPRPHAIAMRAGERLYHEAVSDYARRHCIKPGITGWAQVNGLRGEIDSLEKGMRRVEYDLYYIENFSLAFDLYIMLRSVCIVCDTRNAY